MKWIALFLFCSPLMALYNGNPSCPDMPELGLWTSPDEWWGLKAGYESDWTFAKVVEVDERVSSMKNRFDQFESFRQYGLLTFNIIDRLEIYAMLGSMQVTMSQRPVAGVRMEYETRNNLSWGVGGSVTLVYWNEVVMGVNARYTGAHLSIDQVIQNGVSRRPGNANLDYDEWQVGISFSREIECFIPYIGLVYASMDSCLRNPPSQSIFSFNPRKEVLKNRQPFSMIVGIGLTSGRIVSFNLESRFIGETALSLSGNLRF